MPPPNGMKLYGSASGASAGAVGRHARAAVARYRQARRRRPAAACGRRASYGCSVLRAVIESTGRVRRTSLDERRRSRVVGEVGVRVAREPLQRPGERGGRRLVAGGEQRHELVAQLLAGRAGRPCSSVEDRVAVAGAGRCARRPARRCARRPRVKRRTVPSRLHERHRDQVRRRAASCRARARSASRSSASRLPKTTRWITSSVSACIRGSALQRPPGRPRVELGVGDLGDRRRPALAAPRRGRAAAPAGAAAGARRRAGSAPTLRPDERLQERRAARRPAARRAARRRCA